MCHLLVPKVLRDRPRRSRRHWLWHVRHDNGATRAALLQQSTLLAVVVIERGHRELVPNASTWLPLEIDISRGPRLTSDPELCDYRLAVHVLVRDGGLRRNGSCFTGATLRRPCLRRPRAVETGPNFLPQLTDLIVRRCPTQTEAVYATDHLRRRFRRLLHSSGALYSAVVRVRFRLRRRVADWRGRSDHLAVLPAIPRHRGAATRWLGWRVRLKTQARPLRSRTQRPRFPHNRVDAVGTAACLGRNWSHGLFGFFCGSRPFKLMLTLARTERRKGEGLIQLYDCLRHQNNDKEVDFYICLFMGQVNYCTDK